MSDEETRAYNQDVLRLVGMMTPAQAALIDKPKAWDNLNRVMGHQLGATCFQMTGHFHVVMGLPAPNEPIMPSVTERILRAKLLTEEFFETLFKGLGVTLAVTTDEGKVIQVGPGDLESEKVTWDIHHREGDRYDLVETADGLGDLNVIVNGTGVAFGIPMHFIDYEIYTSNLSKLGEDGKPIINGVTKGYRVSDGSQIDIDKYPDAEIWCDISDSDEPGYRPDAPIGKILKPESFVSTNIPAVLVAYQNKEI